MLLLKHLRGLLCDDCDIHGHYVPIGYFSCIHDDMLLSLHRNGLSSGVKIQDQQSGNVYHPPVDDARLCIQEIPDW